MALSYITREADGVQSQFDFPFGYLSKSHVFVFVDNSLVAFKWISDFLVEPLVRPLAGSSVTIRRLTDRANRVTTYTDGQTLLASSLNAGDLQTFFIAQEMIDQIEEGIVTGDVSVLNPGAGYITAQWIQDQLQAGLAGAPQFAAVDQALTDEAAARAAAILAETNARAAAILAETNARVAAVNDLVADLTSEANARVAAVTALTGAVSAETNARVAAVNAEASARAAQVLSLTQADADQVDRLVVIEADLNTPTTGVKAKLVTVEDLIVTETSARASADSALLAELNDPVTGLKARATSLESRTTAVETGKASASALAALVAEIDDPATGLSTRASQTSVTNLATTVAGKADASRVTALETSVNNPTTGLATRASQQSVTDLSSTVAGKASASELDALEAVVNDPSTGLSTRASQTSVTNLTTTVNSKADASRVTALETSVNNPTTGLTSRALQTDFVALSSTVDGKADASRVTALETSVNNPTTGLSTRASQSDLTTLSVAVDGKASLSAFNTLQTAVNDPSTGLATRASQTSVTNLATTVNSKADATRVTALEASVNNATTGLTSRALQTDFVALSSTVAGKADASRVTALEASVNDPTTGLSTRASQQSVTDLTTTVNGKASASALDALEAVVEDPTTGLTTRASQASLNALSVTVDGKASLSALNSLSTQVNDPSTGLSTRASQQSVTDLTTVVNGKASAVDLDALEVIVQHPTTGLATRASQTALNDLSVTVGQKANASTVTSLSASVDGVRNDLDAAAWDDAAYFWSWDGAAISGFAASNGTLSYPATGGVQVSQSGANADLNLSSPNISYPGSKYTKMVVDVECVTPPSAPIVQDERAYWQTAGHSYSGSFSDRPRQTMPVVAGERKLLVYDFDTAEFGAADYLGNTITRIRFDFPQGLGSVYLVRSVKIVAPATLGALSRINTVEADITTVNTAVADLTANKASASSVTALTATVDTIKMNDANTRVANRIGFTAPANGDPKAFASITFGSAVASANEGQVLAAGGGQNFGHRNYLPILPGRIYRVRARVAATADGTDMRLNVGFRWYSGDFQYQNVVTGFADTTFTVAKGWRTVEWTITAASILAATPTASYLTSRLFIGFNAAGNSAGGTWQIAWSDIADITDLQNTAEIAAASSALNRNPFFAEGSPDIGVLPRGWSNWSNGLNNTVIEARPWGGAGLHARVTPVSGGVGVGWLQNLGQGSVRAGNKYLVRADVARGTGTYEASGVLLQWFNASNGLIASQALPFATERDTSGVVATTGDGRRVFEKTFTAPALATNVIIYAMTAWNGFGQALQTTSPQLRWFECSLHQINSSTAGVTELREALATGTSAEARLLLAVNAATNVASIEAAAFAGDGVWNGSKITLNADLIGLLAKSINFGTNTVFEDTKGTLYTSTGGNRVRILGPFGTSNDLVMWYGPTSVALNSETKTNGAFALATDGKVYLGTTAADTVATSATPLTVSLSPGAYSDVHTTSGTMTVNVTATVSGGTGPYTYFWGVQDILEGGRPTLANNTTATVTVTRGYLAAASHVGVLVLQVTDTATGKSATKYWGYAQISSSAGPGGGDGFAPPP